MKIAKKDIPVFKVLLAVSKTEFGRTCGDLISPIYVHQSWEKGKVEHSQISQPLPIKGSLFAYGILKGLHSFRTLKAAENFSTCSRYYKVIYSAIIPKGSPYYTGSGKKIVSNQLKIVSNVRFVS